MLRALSRIGKPIIAAYYVFMAGLIAGLVCGVVLEAVCVYAIRTGAGWIT